MRASMLVLGLVVAVLNLGGCITNLYEEERTVTADHAAAAPIKVTSQNGAVRIVPGGDRVVVHANVKATSKERLEATKVIAERLPDGTLVIKPEWPGGQRESNEGCSFDITVPGAEGVTIATSNGRIEVSGLDGQAELSTSNGSITVNGQDGPVEATTSNGRITVSRSAGLVAATTSNGSIKVEDAAGPVRVKTSNGGVTVRLADGCTGPVTIDTSNGGVDLEVTPTFRGELAAATSNGGIRVQKLEGATLVNLERSSARLRFGDTGEPSRISTSNGAIEVRSRGTVN